MATLWTQLQDIGPPPRADHAMAYDSTRQRLVLFGGGNNAHLGDTWEWDGTRWTQTQDIGPPARSGHVMAFDTTRGKVVLFGGTSADVVFADTWEWDGGLWVQTADMGPPARHDAGAVFHDPSAAVVLFGGSIVDGSQLGDTWQWDGTSWTQVADTGPAARAQHAMAFMAGTGRTVLFGGDGGGIGLADTWEWDGSSWYQVQDSGPPAAIGAKLAAGPGAAVLYGGFSAPTAGVTHAETWAWDGHAWSEVQDTGPGPKTSHAMAWDDAEDRVVLFGGYDATTTDGTTSFTASGDTWALAGVPSASGGNGGGGNTDGLDLSGLYVTASPNPVGPDQHLTVTIGVANPLAGDAVGALTMTPGPAPPRPFAIAQGQKSLALDLLLIEFFGLNIPSPLTLVATIGQATAQTSLTILH
jgi:hypothetical protein